MPRLQDLHPDQQAVLQLVLRRRMRYGDLTAVLAVSPGRVRERALDAVDGLAPDDVEGLTLEDRDRIADHLLGQDSGADHEAVAALIAGHSPAATWAATVAAELEPLGGPAVALPPAAAPDAQDRGRVDAPADARDGTAGAPAVPPPTVDDTDPAVSPPADAGVRAASPTGAAAAPGPPGPSRRILGGPLARLSGPVLAGSALAGVVVLLLVLWVAGAFSGDDDASSTRAAAPPTTTADAAPTAEERAAAAQFVAALPQTIPFRPPPSATGTFARVRGAATPTISAANPAFPVLRLTITGLPASTEERRYFAWADKDGKDPIFLGQLTDSRGAELPFQGLDLRTREPAVVDPTVYRRVRVTLEDEAAPTEPGRTIIVGTIAPRTG